LILSQEAIKQRAQESAKESTQRLRIEILKAHSMLSQNGVKITRTAIKEQVTGKSQTVTDAINTLVVDGHLFDSKDGLLKGGGPLWEESTRGDFSI
jgi:TRAP-type C4-dicarboxylate transport system substrate-binding protein